MTDRYKEIRDALAKGPTPGEWYWSDAYPTQDGRETWSLIGDGGFGILSCDGEENSPQSVNVAAAELIAACDPDTIRELLTERDQLAAALEAAEMDKARLDWLDTQRGEMVVQGEYTDAPELVGHCWGVEGQCYDVRTAIDAAREARNG